MAGDRDRFRPAVLVIGIGIIFGFFHVTLYRIAPTAALGMVLTAIALLTGSVFPGMLLHAGNNALAVVLGNALNLYVLRWWHFLAAFTIFGLSLFIIYRNRTPLPSR